MSSSGRAVFYTMRRFSRENDTIKGLITHDSSVTALKKGPRRAILLYYDFIFHSIGPFMRGEILPSLAHHVCVHDNCSEWAETEGGSY